MYLDYWKLTKHPFNNVPDPAMHCARHHSVDNAVSEMIFAIGEADVSLAAITGPIGVGKTMCLRLVLNELDPTKFSIAYITNPELTFLQLLREIVGQLDGERCREERKEKLLDEFNRCLFESSDKGRRVVIFIDEGNVMKPHNLESLRLLTNTQDDHENLLTIILAGQPELGRRLENPRRDNLFQRIGVYCKIDGIDSLQTAIDYIEHRLEKAGLSGRAIFTNDAYKEIWKFSENGVPRLINKICKLALKHGETNSLLQIDGDVITSLAKRFRRTAKVTHPTHTTTQRSEPAVPAPENEPRVITMSSEEQELLASKLATEEVKNMSGVTDPFDTWNKARERILSEINRQYQLPNSHAIA